MCQRSKELFFLACWSDQPLCHEKGGSEHRGKKEVCMRGGELGGGVLGSTWLGKKRSCERDSVYTQEEDHDPPKMPASQSQVWFIAVIPSTAINCDNEMRGNSLHGCG